MSGVLRNAEICTRDLVSALEDMSQGDGNLALIYGNSAIAAAAILFHKHGVTDDLARTLFDQVWIGAIASIKSQTGLVSPLG